MKVVALDIASATGWASGRSDSEFVSFGTWKLKRDGDIDNLGPTFSDFTERLQGLLALEHPDLIAFEAPIPPVSGKLNFNFSTTRLLFGLLALAETVADLRNYACEEVPVSTWKLSFTGSGRADKADVIDRCLRLGFKVATDHEADALGILSHVLHAHGQAPAWDAGLAGLQARAAGGKAVR